MGIKKWRKNKKYRIVIYFVNNTKTIHFNNFIKMKYSILFLLCLPAFFVAAQTKPITVENIWKDYTFSARSVPGFNFQKNGRHYTRKEENKVVQYDLLTGAKTKVLLDASALPETGTFNQQFSSYSFSQNEDKMLLASNLESIYRHSTKGNFYVLDRKSNKLSSLGGKDKMSLATFSPDEKRVAFVRNNNLFVSDLVSGETMQITYDGKTNEIINGMADWVYEEEFGKTKAFTWSPNGDQLAFTRFDETEVREFIMTIHNDDAYPEYRKFKYPKVGEKNANVSVHVYNFNTSKTVKMDLGEMEDQYVPRIKWTHDNHGLVVFKMNRHQNNLKLLLADSRTGTNKVLMEETNDYYIDITDDLKFLKDKKHFVWTSEKSGFNHIYLYNMDGKMVRQITNGNYDVTRLYGVDEVNKMIYYQAAEQSPLERQIFSVDMDGKNKKNLTPAAGTNAAQFSSTFDYFVNTFSTANRPPTFTVYDRAGKEIRVIENNKKLVKVQENYGTQPVEFSKIKNAAGDELNAWTVKPPGFDTNKKYPVLMYVYGGPGSQTVNNSYGYNNYWWFQLLAQQGYIVVSVDNRGTGARGEKFKKMTYQQLGKYETEDQIEAAKYLAAQPYVDGSRIGIFGWSYGGYMSSLAILKGNDVFKTAIAVAPVTNWKWYDSIYTERYMRTDDENPDGYKENSPVYFADQLKGNYLLVHGNADDNVHFQNSAEMAKALIKANKQFDTYFYPNRNHGIYGDNARLHLYNKMTDFLMEKL